MSGEHKNNDGYDNLNDGIIELDNPAPMWWQRLFYITIAWGIVYMAWYLLGEGQSQKDRVAQQLMTLELKKRAQGSGPDESASELRAFFKDSQAMASGQEVYAKNCLSCHGPNGGGGIGPHLADAHWIHGDGSIDGIYQVVKDGVADKGMPPWGAVLKRPDLLKVSAYVRSLRGTSPAQPKAPQGNAVTYKNDI
jgi:cytochrome c oxidase cbb3-type subunit 3